MSDPLQFLIFKDTLRDLGYNDKAQFTSGVRNVKTDVTELGGSVFKFISYFVTFDTKESYLWYRCMDMQQKMPTQHYKHALNEFAEAINMDETTRIAEIGWEVKYRIHPGQFSLKDRATIMFEHARRMRRYINDGYGGISPAEGDVLTSYPYGSNVSMQLGMDSWLKGKDERAQFGRLFGLGEPKKNGWNYGRYDSNLKLRPI